MGEFETTVAAPFKHSRQNTLSRPNLLYYFTLEKKWMGGDEAKKLIALAVAAHCYTETKEGEYTLAEHLSEEKIPLGFRPTDAIFDSAVPETQDPIEAILHLLSEKTGKDLKVLASELQEIEKSFDDLIGSNAAVVILAGKYQLDVSSFRAELLRRGEEG